MKQFIVLTFCALILVPEFVRSEILASSGYPMAGANPSRNRQIDKKLLCPDVAPGRTQVWNIEWQLRLPTNFSLLKTDLTQDEQGFVYVYGWFNYQNLTILKINGTDGSYDVNLAYTAPFGVSTAVPTHVKGNKMYIAALEMTAIVNTTSMTDIAVLPHYSFDIDADVFGSYAPLNNDLMATASPALTEVDILRYWNASSAQFVSSPPNFSGAFANNVIIFRNANGVDVPIMVLGDHRRATEIVVWSPNYQIKMPGTNLRYDNSYIQNDQLVVQYFSLGDYSYTMAILDPETGALIQNITRTNFNDATAYFYYLVIFGNKSIAYSAIDYTDNIVDFVNEKVIIKDRELLFNPLYSIPDKSVLLATLAPKSAEPALEFISLDWDSEVINAVGSLPTNAYLGYILSSPMVGEDCMLYQSIDDSFNYPPTLFAFKPLPVSNIIPILECINADGIGYFSYNNTEDNDIIIPYAHDRNNLKPMGLAPAKEFKAHRRGKYFPMSSRVSLDSSMNSFTWQLEDYVLSFPNTPQLRCPQDVTIVLYFSATNAVPSGFNEWTRQVFVNITGISDARVTVVPNNSHGSRPQYLGVKLHITTGNSSQPTPEQAVQNFATGKQLESFKELLANDPVYSTSKITFIDVDGTGPLATELYGTVPQTPINQPGSQHQPNTHSPTHNEPEEDTSTGSVLALSSVVVTFVFVSLM